MTAMRRTAVFLLSCVLVAAGLAAAGGVAPPAAAMPHGTPVFLVGDSTMLGMAYGGNDARSIVAASYSLTYDAASCRRVLAPSCRGHGVIPLSVVPTMQQYAGRLGSVVVVMAGYDDIDISAGVDAVLAEAARQGVQRVLWLDYPTNVPYHQPLSSANVAPIYQRHNAVLAAKAAANPMLAIAPWAAYSAGHPEWFQPDGIHLRFPPGADALARFIVAQLEALTPPRCTATLAGDLVAAPAVVPAVKAPEAKLAPATPPDRILDTRADDGDAFTLPVGAGRSLRVPLDANGATSAVVNLTAADPCADGYLTAYPCDEAVPLASNVNYRARGTASALATVPLDDSGDLCVYTMSTTDVVVDLYAFSRASAHDGFRELGPTRLLDTRDGSGAATARGALTPDTPLTVSVTSAGVPAQATAVALNITAIAPKQAAYVRVAPCGADPLVSSLNVQAGQIVANAGVVAVSTADTLCVTANAATDVVLDVTGWYGPGGGDSTSVQTPTRLVDTRSGLGGTRVAVGATLAVTIPRSSAAAATVSVAVVNPDKPGYVTVRPCDAPAGTSTLNYVAGDTVANTATVGLDDQHRLCVSTSATADLVVDLLATSQ
jgi:hypothetical protein